VNGVLPLVHRVLSSLIAWSVALQFFLAGAGAFGAATFHYHVVLGSLLPPAALLAFAAAALARRHVRETALVLALVTAQLALGWYGVHHEPWVGALHGLTAIGVMFAAGNLARLAWRGPRPEAAAA
jgi:hypothetical protein